MNSSNISDLIFSTLQEINEETARKRLPTTIYLLILMIIGIIGNLFVICFYGQSKKKNNFQVFTVCLALIDLTACCVYIPVEIVDQTYPYMFYSEAACKICRCIGRVTTIGSALVLLVISIERHRKICLPFEDQVSYRSAKYLCVLALLISVMLSWPTLAIEGIKVKHFDGNVTGYYCGTADGIRETMYPFIYTILLLVIYSTVFLTLIVLYSAIIRKLLKTSSLVRNSGSYHVKRTRSITKIMLCFSVAFIVSYLPHFGLEVNSTIKRGNYGPTTPLTLAALPLLSRSYFINNVVNPFILAIGDKTFRNGFWKMVKRCFSTILCIDSLKGNRCSTIHQAESMRSNRIESY